MREIDPRSRYSRRTFLKGAASAAPAAAIAAGTGLTITDAWAEDGQALSAPHLKTMVKMARDIFPHDFLGDVYYITAIKPWDKKAAGDAAVKSMLVDRVALLQGIEHTEFFGKIRADMVVSLYNQHDLWPKFGYEGSSAEYGGYINRGFNDIDWLPKV